MDYVNHIILLDTFIFNYKHPEKYTYAFNNGFSKVMNTSPTVYQINTLLKRYEKLHELTIQLSDKRYAVICNYRIEILQNILANG